MRFLIFVLAIIAGLIIKPEIYTEGAQLSFVYAGSVLIALDVYSLYKK